MKRKVREQDYLKKKLQQDPYINIVYRDDPMWGEQYLNKPRYVKYSNGNRTGNNNIQTWFKKYSNRKVRNYNKGLSNGCEYKKILDPWIYM